MARLVAPLLLLTAAALAAADVTGEDDVTAELLTSALKDAGYDWPLEHLRTDQLSVPLDADWGRLAARGRPRRAPQGDDDDVPRRKKRRRKNRRKGRKRNRNRSRKRQSTRAEVTTTAMTPTTRAAAAESTAAPAVTQAVVPRGRSGGRRRTTAATTAAPTTPTTPPPPPLPDYNVAPEGTVNERPVIGVLTQALPSNFNSLVPDVDFSSYIAASYVKFLEAAGARVVPVMVDQSEHYYREMFRYLNGLLLPGGSVDLDGSGYATAARAMWKVSAQHSEDHFPMIGIGQGLELIAAVVEQRSSFKDCPASNQAGPLFFEPGGERSRLLAGAGDRVRQILSSQEATVSFHGRCLTPSAFRGGRLARDFSLVATSRDAAGRPFVSAIEHRRLPIFGVQFQPEMPQFEWSRAVKASSIPHTADAIIASQHLANAFVGEARNSRHRFPSTELEQDYLIFNYEPEYTGVMGADFTSCYFFS